MPMVDQLADHLATLAFGTVATDIFCHSMPTTPDACMSLHQFGPGSVVMTMTGAIISESINLQVQCRDTDDTAAEARCYAVFAALAPIANQTIGGTWYQGSTGQRPPAKLRVDSEGRAIYYCEMIVMKELS